MVTILGNLTNSKGFDGSPSWSPSGERIAFASSRNRAKYDIYVMDADGSNLQRLTKDGESDYSPDWSRSAFSVSPASKQLLIWGWLKSERR